MNRQISQKEAIFRFSRAFLGQYLSTMHNFNSFQEDAINMMTNYFIQVIRSLAVKVMNILRLQGRTIPNSLHLLVVIDQLELMDFQQLHAFIINRKEVSVDTKSLDIIEKVGKKLFENDLQTINNYPKEKISPNIRYVPPAFVADLNKIALPYKHSIDTAFEMPPERTYRQTKEKIVKQKKNIEFLSAYTKRQNKIALNARMIDNQKDKHKSHSKENKDNINEVEEIYGRLPEKKLKFSTVEYI